MPMIQKKSFFFVLIQHFFRLDVDSQTDQPAGHILPEGISTHQADAGDKDLPRPDIELETDAEGREMGEAA